MAEEEVAMSMTHGLSAASKTNDTFGVLGQACDLLELCVQRGGIWRIGQSTHACVLCRDCSAIRLRDLGRHTERAFRVLDGPMQSQILSLQC